MAANTANKKDGPATGREVALISSDGQKYFVPPSVVRTSRVLGKKLKDLAQTSKGGKSDGSVKSWDKSFTLQQISGETLEQIIRWARHHKGAWTYKVNGEPVAHTTPWDDQFVAQLQRDDLFKLSLAAKDLEIEGLLQLTCKEIAKMIAGKTPEQVRSEFGVVCDFTPEEEEEIRRENELLFGAMEGDGSSDGEDVRAIENGSKTPDKVQTVTTNGNEIGKKNNQQKPSTNSKSGSWFEPSPICRCRNCFLYYRQSRP